ncbi:putative RNA/DNA demethylase ALKBH6 [Alosa pseudoharengus]|uniref:putative RNA/DNA demethylase ALKBH6 n=1 Tax=Alosa pseudoharengus TaxID=34774 RepID=UPI003F8B36ED
MIRQIGGNLTAGSKQACGLLAKNEKAMFTSPNMAYPCEISKELGEYIVTNAPPTVYYIPDFITEVEEQYLLQEVYKAPKPKWTQLSGRRLQNWGGLPRPKGMLAEKLPDWLLKYTNRISALGAFAGKAANHVLVNEYTQGEGIMPHVDGPLYHPTVTTISLGSHTLLDFYRPISQCEMEGPQTEESRYLLSLLLRPRSLLILQDEMYQHLLHGIQNVCQDTLTERVANLFSALAQPGEALTRGTRVSLTIRHVPKIVHANILLGRK